MLATTTLFTQTTTALSPTCNTTTANFTLYPITVEGTTIAEVAQRANRSICDIGRYNLMADVTIIPNVGQTIVIPPLECTSQPPDNESCLLPNITRTRTCINGGPRLYYTVHGDTYEVIARRLNITTEALMGNTSGNDASATDLLEVGQFVKVPLCEPSSCAITPFTLTFGVYEDLAEEYGTTVGQIMMLSPTYNYSTSLMTGETRPTLDLPVNCTALADVVTVID
ncbi:uncharacterized protein BP01DRAFT_303448 [Aspergillus saccharolyticus JOP 1030-1]|uniref:LysM domain-containing protein n=1 Tax=Aspergillus saccharolyticus JOP 1030-1 TaxID=1450539 RepID=A0A318Z535_9EURO|nr:hypothetical protein BP01DRAFT_303448 [Aspergillus saccharolyticus JOP 1030-1]PYH42421.1 hypothetical protein BP01DRAFT_303448 [Aspergillus saccharolyticus JOP 1030-1]